MIYISNDNESLDANVGIEIKLPCLPRIKDELFLTNEQISELEEMAKSDLKIAENYFPKYFFFFFYLYDRQFQAAEIR